MSDGAITTQPTSRRKEVEAFVRDLDPLQVVGECTLHYMLDLAIQTCPTSPLPSPPFISPS